MENVETINSEIVREMIAVSLGRASRMWRTKVDERLEALGLTTAKWLILIYLDKASGSMPQKDLAESVGVEGPTLVSVLDGLERIGLIERRGQPSDRRAKVVHLTAKSSPVLKEIKPLVVGVRDEVLAGIPDEDLVVCERVVSAMLGNMGVSARPKF